MKLRNPFLSLCPIFLQNYQRCLSTTCPRGPWGKINLVGLQLPSLFPFIYLYFNPFHRLVGWLFDFSFKLWLCSDICRREGVGNKQKNNFRKLLHTFKGLKILNRTTFLQTPSLNYWFELIRKIMLVLICGFSFLCSQTAFYSFQLECQCLETFFLSSQRLFLLIIFCSE
jgi:hypothetical protein